MLYLFSIQIFLFSGGIFMPDGNNEQGQEKAIKETSKMADRLKRVLKKCKKTMDDEILVPQDVKKRMKDLCSETEKIIKDMPNKKFSAAVYVHAGGKAKKYLETLNKEMCKVNYNLKIFADLKSFYGVSEGNVKSGIKKYDEKMEKYSEKFNDIYKKIGELVKENSKLLGENKLKELEGLSIEDFSECDSNLLNAGYVGRYNKNVKTYEGYVEAFFNKFINCKIGDDKKDLVSAFKDISIALYDLKGKVSANEAKIVGRGIGRSRKAARDQMLRIDREVNLIIRRANESVSFLKALPIKSSELSNERDKQVEILDKKISDCNSTLNYVDTFKSSVVYGETTFSSNKKSYLAIGKGVDGTFLRANSLRRNFNNFIKLLDNIVSDIHGGGRVEFVSKEAKGLNGLFDGNDGIKEDLIEFKGEVKKFDGYFKEYFVGKGKGRKDINKKSNEETVRKIDIEYDRIARELREISVPSINSYDDKLGSMEKKIEKEVEEYNKISSKIKRGVKKVFHVMGTIARYTLNVTEFLKNVMFISDTWRGLAGAFSQNDEAAAQAFA